MLISYFSRYAYKLSLLVAGVLNLLNLLSPQPTFACGGYCHECRINYTKNEMTRKADIQNKTLGKLMGNWISCEAKPLNISEIISHEIFVYNKSAPIKLGDSSRFEEYNLLQSYLCKGLRGVLYYGDGTGSDDEELKKIRSAVLDLRQDFNVQVKISSLPLESQLEVKRAFLEQQTIEPQDLNELITIHASINAEELKIRIAKIIVAIEKINEAYLFLTTFNDPKNYIEWNQKAKKTQKIAFHGLTHLHAELTKKLSQ